MGAPYNTKFFSVKTEFKLAELCRIRQYPWEDMDAYMKRFHRKATDWCGPVAEVVLVDICLHGIIEDYHYLENVLFFFSLIWWTVRQTNKSVKRTSKTSWQISSMPKNKPIITTVEKNKGAKASSLKKMPHNRRKIRGVPTLPPFACGVKKDIALQE